MLTFSVFFFFFSSRRRHTRSLCDWSSDVCSSDLPPAISHAFDMSGLPWNPSAWAAGAPMQGSACPYQPVLQSIGGQPSAAPVSAPSEADLYIGALERCLAMSCDR